MATYYINADTGSDTAPGDGTSAHPWATLSKAYTSSTAGDTIYVQNATATYSFASASMQDRILTGQSATGCVFDGAAASRQWTLGSGTSTFAINNITFQNVLVADSGLFKINGALTFTATGCIFKNTIKLPDLVRTGIAGGASWTNGATVSFVNCLFSDVQRNTAASGTALFGFQGVAGATLTLNVTGCTIYLAATGTSQVTGVFSFYGPSGGIAVLNVKNTIIKNATGGTVSWASFASFASVTYNASYSDFQSITNAPAGTGVITSDPLLVDPANSNFRLRPTSPCLGTGVVV